jgi:DNA primase
MDARIEITKPEHVAVLDYYRRVMPRLEVHFAGTPLVWVTYPMELGFDPVYHKGVEHAPETIPTIAVRTSTGVHQYVALNAHNLTWLVAGRFAVEIHGWSPLASDPGRAAFARVVLSPHGSANDAAVVAAAHAVRHALAAEKLAAIPVLDGFRGITVWIPFDDGPSYDRLGTWTRTFAANLAEHNAAALTVENHLAGRGDRVYLGTKSNHPGMGSLLPYALRGTPSLEVSLPVHWDDLDRVRNGDVTAATYAEYDANAGDVFAAMQKKIGAQSFGDRAPQGTPKRLVIAIDRPEQPAPRGFIISAALRILADGREHDAQDILDRALALGLLPRSTTRKYVYTALHEYVERTIGAGRKPAFVQIEGKSAFRINHEPDTWPDVPLPPRPAWLTQRQVDEAAARLEQTSTGGDPQAFELAVTEAFAALGFLAQHIGGNGEPDVVLTAPLGPAGYRAIVECKTASPGGVVANPRADEPARFRDARKAQYALVIGSAFGHDAALDDELRAHNVSLWTTRDLAACLRAQLGPAAMGRLFTPGRAGDAVNDALWQVAHGERKRVAVIAGIIHEQLWRSQRDLATAVPAEDAPIVDEDAVLLLVDEALHQAGVIDGATRLALRAALRTLETNGVLDIDATRGIIALVPPGTFKMQ